MTPSAMDEPVEAADTDLMQLVRQLWAGKYWVIAFTLVFGISAYLVAKSTPPTFRADALMQLEDNSAQMRYSPTLGQILELFKLLPAPADRLRLH
ncbi:MAG: hypothetical protein B7X55_11730 [Rhodobacterales bacterium 34-62-10]|nr:MAG: hypothetical protein B7X55_11730 [Rhodobacterales bacterium 34-62-10]